MPTGIFTKSAEKHAKSSVDFKITTAEPGIGSDLDIRKQGILSSKISLNSLEYVLNNFPEYDNEERSRCLSATFLPIDSKVSTYQNLSSDNNKTVYNVGIVYDYDNIDIKYAEFYARNTGAKVPKLVSKGSENYNKDGLNKTNGKKTKHPDKIVRECRVKGSDPDDPWSDKYYFSHETDYSRWDVETQSVVNNDDNRNVYRVLETFYKAFKKKFEKRSAEAKQSKDEFEAPYNELLIQKAKNAKGPSIGGIELDFKRSAATLKPEISKALIKHFTQFPHLKLYIRSYNVKPYIHVIKDPQIIQDLLKYMDGNTIDLRKLKEKYSDAFIPLPDSIEGKVPIATAIPATAGPADLGTKYRHSIKKDLIPLLEDLQGKDVIDIMMYAWRGEPDNNKIGSVVQKFEELKPTANVTEKQIFNDTFREELLEVLKGKNKDFADAYIKKYDSLDIANRVLSAQDYGIVRKQMHDFIDLYPTPASIVNINGKKAIYIRFNDKKQSDDVKLALQNFGLNIIDSPLKGHSDIIISSEIYEGSKGNIGINTNDKNRAKQLYDILSTFMPENFGGLNNGHNGIYFEETALSPTEDVKRTNYIKSFLTPQDGIVKEDPLISPDKVISGLNPKINTREATNRDSLNLSKTLNTNTFKPFSENVKTVIKKVLPQMKEIVQGKNQIKLQHRLNKQNNLDFDSRLAAYQSIISKQSIVLGKTKLREEALNLLYNDIEKKYSKQKHINKVDNLLISFENALKEKNYDIIRKTWSKSTRLHAVMLDDPSKLEAVTERVINILQAIKGSKTNNHLVCNTGRH